MSFPGGIDLRGFWKKFKQRAGGHDFGRRPWCGHPEPVYILRASEHDIHLVQALKRDDKVFLVAQGEQLKSIKRDLSMRMSHLGDAQGNVGVHQDYRGSSIVPE